MRRIVTLATGAGLALCIGGLVGCTLVTESVQSMLNGGNVDLGTVVTNSLTTWYDESELERMKTMPVEVVLEECKKDPLFSTSPGKGKSRRDIMLEEGNAQVRVAQIDLDAYESMLAELESTIRGQLLTIAEREPAAGPSGTYGIVIDEFENGVGNAEWLDGTLDDIAVNLRTDTGLPDRITIVPVGLRDPSAIINRVSAPGEWVSIDESNVAALRVVKFHPDDVYVLSGSMSMRTDARKFRVEFKMTALLSHPRTQSLEGACRKLVRGYLYHPAQGKWITDAENDQLRASYKG